MTCEYCVLQLRVMATDLGGLHARNSSNQAKITVSVKRNLNSPQFQNLPYKKTIQQTQEGGSTVFNVHARDQDDSVRNSIMIVRNLQKKGIIWLIYTRQVTCATQ